MLRSACFLRVVQGGAPRQRQQPRRATFHALSSTKLGKERFTLADSLRRDRENAERNRSLPWHERLKQLKTYPWKFFVIFMVLWSWLGMYVVPYVKGIRPGEMPALGGRRFISQELKQPVVLKPMAGYPSNGTKNSD